MYDCLRTGRSPIRCTGTHGVRLALLAWELGHLHVVSSWSLCTWYRAGACARGIDLEPVHVVSSWSLCTWYRAGACARGIDLEPVHVVSSWSTTALDA
jgi:uncharacterized protein (DUF2237 family)